MNLFTLNTYIACLVATFGERCFYGSGPPHSTAYYFVLPEGQLAVSASNSLLFAKQKRQDLKGHFSGIADCKVCLYLWRRVNRFKN